ncbi:D-amino-acid oxidase [Halenospora varia]|nr:D-amino-acid oxidase [Halenospora varia]
MIKANIVVVGAGVAGLTTALLLSKQKRYSITVVAKHMPGDYDIEYTSPWAGANYVPESEPDTPEMEWDRVTFKELWKLANDVPAAGIHIQKMIKCYREKDNKNNPGQWQAQQNSWYKDILPDFKVLPESDLPPTVDAATTFKTMCINTAIYLPWLISQCLAAGIVFNRSNLTSLTEASSLHHTRKLASLIVNCTGLLAHKIHGLGPDGKGDKLVYPARGQIVLVRNEVENMVELSAPVDGGDEMTYIMTRAAGGGTVLGGCYQKGNWDSQSDPNLALRIMTRAVELCPELANGKGVEGLDVVRHGVGLRPAREGGTRIDASWVDGVLVVHNYGHAGFGYQSSYGCSEAVVRVVEDVLEDSIKVPKEQDVWAGKVKL